MIIFSDNIGILCSEFTSRKKKIQTNFRRQLLGLDNSMFRIIYRKFNFIFLKIKDNFRKMKVFQEYFFVNKSKDGVDMLKILK